MKLLFPIFIFASILSSCKRDCSCAPPYEIYYLKAEVKETSNTDCIKPLLSFEEDSVRIRLISGRDDILFIAKGLAPSLNLLNKKIYVNVAVLTADEEFPCHTLGISYCHIKVLDAKERK